MATKQVIMKYSKSKVDQAGQILANDDQSVIEKYLLAEDVFDDYRSAHLEPLMKTTLDLQKWMEASSKGYYIALRLKRKPQILRKLKRFHVRLSQLQDIAGTRIILDKNSDVDETAEYLLAKIRAQEELKLSKDTDYRIRGRDDSGYRARHIILDYNGYKIELQLRSKIQHFWAEKIERTSVVYGYFLKELEGDPIVLNYFKQLSDVFYEFEANRRPSYSQRLNLDQLYPKALAIIEASDKHKVLNSHPDRNVLKTLTEISQANPPQGGLYNWILIFNWDTGNFVNWLRVTSDPIEAIKLYSNNEKDFPAQDNFEVVLVGASDVSTIEQTHSHYFGIESYEGVLQNLDESVESIKKAQLITIGERRILTVLYRRHMWNTKSIKVATIKRHMCAGMSDFDESLEALIKKRFVLRANSESPLSLNMEKKSDIDKLMQ